MDVELFYIFILRILRLFRLFKTKRKRLASIYMYMDLKMVLLIESIATKLIMRIKNLTMIAFLNFDCRMPRIRRETKKGKDADI